MLASTAVAHADSIGVREEPIVHGDPVEPGRLYGTVGITSADPSETADEVRMNRAPWCTGVLIAPSVVLTAAHCLEVCQRSCDGPDGECYWCEEELRAPSELRVLAGLRTIDDQFRADVVEVARVREHFVPEAYVRSDSWTTVLTLIHDIAVLQLEDPIERLTPVPMPVSVDDLEGESATAIGYGQRTPPGSDELLEQDHYRTVLHETRVQIEHATSWNIVTRANEDRSGTCFGDSGGPLYVSRGGGVEAAGIASRFSVDENCGGGTVYTSTSAYADWIYEKAPEAIPFAVHSGGGCSATTSHGRASGAWLLGLLFSFALARRRAAIASLILVGGLVPACGSNGEVDYCSDERDPSGFACSRPDTIAFAEAQALARAEVPNEAWLWWARGSAVDPDGRAYTWYFAYYVPERRELPEAEFINVAAGSTGAHAFDPGVGSVACIPTRPLEPIDSRRVIRESIRMLEDAGYPVVFDGNGLFDVLHRHFCNSNGPAPSTVSFEGQVVYLDEQGNPIGSELTER